MNGNKTLILTQVQLRKRVLVCESTYFYENNESTINETEILEIKQRFDLDKEEEILFLSKHEYFDSNIPKQHISIFLEDFLLFSNEISENGRYAKFSWKAIKNVRRIWDKKTNSHLLEFSIEEKGKISRHYCHCIGIPKNMSYSIIALINTIAKGVRRRSKQNFDRILRTIYDDQDFDKALIMIDKEIDISPNDDVILYLKAECLMYKGNYAEANEKMELALQIFEKNRDNHD